MLSPCTGFHHHLYLHLKLVGGEFGGGQGGRNRWGWAGCQVGPEQVGVGRVAVPSVGPLFPLPKASIIVCPLLDFDAVRRTQ